MSGKLAAHIEAIKGYDWTEAEKTRAIELAIRNADTLDSVTANGRYHPPGLSEGEAIPARYPGRETTVNERAIREDMTDHS